MPAAMASRSRVAYWANKVAVPAEPGLTGTQLMVSERNDTQCLLLVGWLVG